MKHHPLLLALAAALLLSAATAGATTWHVEKDGTGDFTIIQEAVDAAASGDTIQIGPGRYDDWFWVVFGNSVGYVESHDKDLTFLGAGAEATVIGHDVIPFIDSVNILGLYSHGDGIFLRVKDIGFENIRRAASVSFSDGRIEVEHCRFEHCSWGVYAVAQDGGWIRNCVFTDVGYWPTASNGKAVTLSDPTSDVKIENCQFTDCFGGIGCYWDYTTDVEVINCDISGGRTGVAFVDRASGTVRDCHLEGQEWYGVVGSDANTVVLEDNEIIVNHPDAEATGVRMYRSGGGNWTLRRNLIKASNGNTCFRLYTPYEGFFARDNHFIRDDTESLFCWALTATPVCYNIDVSGNYWGTTDSAEIAAGILDRNDDDEMNYYFIYEPFLEGEVPVQKESFGGMKALFRGR